MPLEWLRFAKTLGANYLNSRRRYVLLGGVMSY